MPRILLSVVLALAAAGCGGKEALVQVAGRVTLDGKAVKDVVVTFSPVGETPGNGAHGYTDADGRFTLTDARGKAGARAGAYLVSLLPSAASRKEDDPRDVVNPGGGRLPGLYSDPAQTPLRATVPAGGGTVDIILTGSGKGATTKTTPATPSG